MNGNDSLVPNATTHAVVIGVLKDVSGQLAADELEDELLRAGSIPHPTGPHAPTLYVSLLASPQGFGAVTLLRQAYEQINAASATPSASAVEPTATAAGRLVTLRWTDTSGNETGFLIERARK